MSITNSYKDVCVNKSKFNAKKYDSLDFFINFNPLFYGKNKKNYMTKSYYYQVSPVLNSYFHWCVAFMFSVFGNLAIIFKDDSFLHIINPFIN